MGEPSGEKIGVREAYTKLRLCVNTETAPTSLNCFSAEARALGVIQAAVSHQVQALEKALCISLFHRRRGRVLPQSAG